MSMFLNMFKSKKKDDLSQNTDNNDDKDSECKNDSHIKNNISSNNLNNNETNLETINQTKNNKPKTFGFIKKGKNKENNYTQSGDFSSKDNTKININEEELPKSNNNFKFIKKKKTELAQNDSESIIKNNCELTNEENKLSRNIDEIYSVLNNETNCNVYIDSSKNNNYDLKSNDINKESTVDPINNNLENIKKTKKFEFVKKKDKTKQIENNNISDITSVTESITHSVKKLKEDLNSNYKNFDGLEDNKSITASVSENTNNLCSKSNLNSMNKSLVNISNKNSSNNTRKISVENNIISSNSPVSLKKQCKENLDRNQTQLFEIYSSINNLKQNINTYNKQIKEKCEQLSNITEKIDIAIADENYLKAEDLQNKTNNIKIQIERLNTKCEELSKELLQLKERELISYKTILNSYKEVSHNFNKLEEHTLKEISDLKVNEISKHKNDEFRIKKLKEKLENLEQSIEINKEDLNIEEDKINSLIGTQSLEISEELGELNIAKTKINEEIEDIKKLLEEKLLVLDSISLKIKEKENEIEAIKSNFKPEYKKLNAKKAKYDEDIIIYNEQIEELSKLEENLKHKEDNYKIKIQNLENMSDQYKYESLKFNSLIEKIGKEVIEISNNLTKENEIKSKIYLDKQDYNQILVNTEEKKNNLNLLISNLKSYQKEIYDYDLKLPELEEEKRKFVSLKNFKEAGKIASEIKKINEHKLNISNNIDKIKLEKQSIENNIGEMNLSNSKKINEIKNSEVILDCINYENLKIYEDNIKLLINEFNSNLLDKEDIKLKNNDALNNSIKKKIDVLKKGLDIVSDEILELEILDHIKNKYFSSDKKDSLYIDDKKESDISRTKDSNQDLILLEINNKEDEKIIVDKLDINLTKVRIYI